VLLVYGYRHAPIGIRARVLDAECTNFATAEEIVLREDGGKFRYWLSVGDDDFETPGPVVYYFNQANGPRHIAGTLVEIGR